MSKAINAVKKNKTKIIFFHIHYKNLRIHNPNIHKNMKISIYTMELVVYIVENI